MYDRRYVSIVMGDMEKDQGTVRSWLTDRKLYVSSSPVDDGGKLSITHYRTIKRANGYSLMECNWKRDARTRFACTCSRSVIR